MPALVHKTSLKHVGDGFNLFIDARHVLVAGHSTDAPTLVKARPPDDIDIVLNADLVLSFAAAADGYPISGSSLCSSSCLRHVLAYLRANEHQLGLCMVSDPYMANDRPKVTLSSAWAYGCPGNLTDSRQPSLTLNAIDITFTLRSTEKTAAANMFSERAYLPFTTALDRAFQKFVTLHLIRRYPLIFGGWRRKVDGELSYAPSIAKSALSIIQRSTDRKFKRKCNRLLSGLDQELSSAASRARQNLAHHLNMAEPIKADKGETLSHQDIVTSSLARFLKMSIRPSCTKDTKLSSGVYVDSDKEELQIQNEEAPATTRSPHLTMLTHDLCWDDLPLLSTAQSSVAIPRDSEYSLCSQTDEDDVLGLENSDQDLILENSSDAGDDIECEDFILDDSGELYQPDNDMIYEDEDDDIQVVEDDDLCWPYPNLLDDDPWEPDSSSPFQTAIDFESLSTQSGSQDEEELITPQDSQCLLHDNNVYSHDAFQDMLFSIDCELPTRTGLSDVDDSPALRTTHNSPKFSELIDSDDDSLMFLDEPHAIHIDDDSNDTDYPSSNEVLCDL